MTRPRAGLPLCKAGTKFGRGRKITATALEFASSGDHAGKEQGTECKPCRAALTTRLWLVAPERPFSRDLADRAGETGAVCVLFSGACS